MTVVVKIKIQQISLKNTISQQPTTSAKAQQEMSLSQIRSFPKSAPNPILANQTLETSPSILTDLLKKELTQANPQILLLLSIFHWLWTQVRLDRHTNQPGTKESDSSTRVIPRVATIHVIHSRWMVERGALGARIMGVWRVCLGLGIGLNSSLLSTKRQPNLIRQTLKKIHEVTPMPTDQASRHTTYLQQKRTNSTYLRAK